jgi:phosphatidylglycerol:prolipoprotein diacylglycerol transferase
MHSVVFQIGPLVVRSYGLLLAVSFAVGLWFALTRAKRWNVKPDLVLDLFLIILLSSVFGSRFFYVIFHLSEFEGHPWDMINPVQSSGELGIAGLSMVGGVVLAVGFGVLYLFIKKQNVWRIADMLSPAFMLGLGITRIGCYLNGCCFGKPTHSCVGVVFPYDSAAGYFNPDIPIYPTQLFHSGAGFLIFFFLIWAEKHKRFDGFTFWLMISLFSLQRIIIDFFRYYEPEMIFASTGSMTISINQAVLAPVMVFSIFIWNYLRRKELLTSKKN